MPATALLLPLAAAEHFSLADTLCCGQCFRWQGPDAEGWYMGVAGGRVCRVRQETRGILLDAPPSDEVFWHNYFDCGTSYAAIRQALCTDETLRRAAQYAPGIRVLRQDGWEALCTFIISQNNNIPRIKGIVERLCALLGEPLAGGLTAFPTPERLSGLSPEALAPLRAGFRAAYLLDAAKRVATGQLPLAALYTLPIDEARAALQTIHGVGPKVAECALLYGFARMECFPMDVWMKRAMAALFPHGLPENARAHAGIAQQYIFHYARTCPEFEAEHMS